MLVPNEFAHGANHWTRICAFFCEEASGTLHQFSTLQSDSNVRSMTLDLKDTSLLIKLEGGDLIALEAKYYLNCLTKFRNHHRSYIRESQNDFNQSHEGQKKEAIAFVEILVYIENSVEEGNFFINFRNYYFFMKVV